MSRGGIVYALVARGTVVLAEHTATTGNFQQVTRLILDKVPYGEDNRIAFAYDQHVFHIVVHQGFVFLAMCDESFPRRHAFSMLDDVKKKFLASHADEGRSAVAYGLNRQFSRVLKEQLEFWTSNPERDKIEKTKADIDEVKSVMVQNIDRILERGEKIELLVDKAEAMNEQAFKFRHVAGQLKRKMWWQNMKLWAIIVVLFLAIILVIILAIHPWSK